MVIGVVKETFPGESRVALIPAILPLLTKKGFDIVVESGAGLTAGFPDEEYQAKGATILGTRAEVFARAATVAQVRTLGANPQEGRADLSLMREGQVFLGLMEPLTALEEVRQLAAAKVTSFALELVPRISRAQAMDVLSSMATIAGYKAVLMAANELPRMFPMMMTAAGTVKPAKVFIVGVGVAGLQAIASARRLGAVVQAYDIRPAVKEQVESLGGRFVEFDLKTDTAEDKGGYAKAMDEDFYKRQREMMGRVVAENDVVITTAAVPGRKAPILVTGEMIKGMHPGSVVIDLAAERGGNCDVTKPGEVVEIGGVRIFGPTNIPATVPYHASQMFSQNVATFILNTWKTGDAPMNTEDEIVRETLVTRNGEISNAKVSEAMSKSAAPAAQGSA